MRGKNQTRNLWDVLEMVGKPYYICPMLAIAHGAFNKTWLERSEFQFFDFLRSSEESLTFELDYSIVPSKGSPLCPDSEILAERHLYFSTVYIICFIIGRVILGARLSKYRRKRLATFDMSRSSRSTQFSTHRMYHVLGCPRGKKENFSSAYLYCRNSTS